MTGASSILTWLAPRAIPGIEVVSVAQPQVYRRSLSASTGPRVGSVQILGERVVASEVALERLFDIDGMASRLAADDRLRWASRLICTRDGDRRYTRTPPTRMR